MARTILTIGESGSGKTTALRTLNPKESFLINSAGKDLPWQGWKKDWFPYDKASKTGNMLSLNSYDWKLRTNHTIGMLGSISNMENVKVAVIDDVQYLMSYEFMERAKEQGWQKFTDIGQNMFNIIKAAERLRDDQTVIFLCHSTDEYYDGGRRTKIKTIGKMLDEKITVEGMFTIVLLAVAEDTNEGIKYQFITKNDGTTTAKSPEGMFPMKIPNDFKYVLDRIEEYNNG